MPVLPGQSVVQPEVLLTGFKDAAAEPAWMKEGSYSVFRQLQQQVPEFHEFTRGIAQKWQAEGVVDVSPDLCARFFKEGRILQAHDWRLQCWRQDGRKMAFWSASCRNA